MTTPYAGSNITGMDGLIAVDKVGNHIRFYDPETLREIKSFPAPEPAAHELAITHDRRLAFVPLYGDGTYGNNKKPNNKTLVIDLAAQALVDIIPLGEMTAPHGLVATSDGKPWVVADIPNKLLVVDPAKREIEAAYDCPPKGAHQMALLPDESKVYVSCKEGDLAVFDRRRREFTAAVPMRAPGVTSGNGSGSEGVMPPRPATCWSSSTTTATTCALSIRRRTRRWTACRSSGARRPTRNSRASPS
jgi:DNA-binding beta-propeller fold protein YncE